MSDSRKEYVDKLKDFYKPGDRIVIDRMDCDIMPIEPGTAGTIVMIDDIGTLHCRFDNGRHLGVCREVDRFHRIGGEADA